MSSEYYNLKDTKFIISYERETPPLMTKFERARILGIRAEQLSRNAASVYTQEEIIDLRNKNPALSSMYVARKELKSKKIPLFIRRHLPNGTSEDWKIKHFKDEVLA